MKVWGFTVDARKPQGVPPLGMRSGAQLSCKDSKENGNRISAKLPGRHNDGEGKSDVQRDSARGVQEGGPLTVQQTGGDIEILLPIFPERTDAICHEWAVLMGKYLRVPLARMGGFPAFGRRFNVFRGKFTFCRQFPAFGRRCVVRNLT